LGPGLVFWVLFFAIFFFIELACIIHKKCLY
jgi:hypothetical protein